MWMSDYSDDYFQTLLETESCRKPFKFRSPQISDRTRLMKLMKRATTKLKLSRITLHLGCVRVL